MVLVLDENKNFSSKLRKINEYPNEINSVVETVVRAAKGQEQHKQIPEKLFSECAYLIFNTEIKHQRVISDRPSALLQ